MPTMLSSIFSKDKDPHSQSRRKEYEFFDSSPIGTGGYSEVRLARWHPKTFPSIVEEWFAQQDKWAAQHPGEEHGEKIVPKGDRKGKEGLVVAVKVVKKEAVRNNPEYFKILHRYVFGQSACSGRVNSKLMEDTVCPIEDLAKLNSTITSVSA